VLHDHFDRVHPTTIFLCVHKAASTFLTADLAPAVLRVFPEMNHMAVAQEIIDGKRLEDLPIPPAGMIVTRMYPDVYDRVIECPQPARGRFADKKLIMLRRDPRDVAISLYYSIRFSHTSRTRNRQHFLGRPAMLGKLDVAGGVAAITHKPSIDQFLTTVRFLNRYPQTLLTTYEQLIEDFPGWLRQVQHYLGWTDDQTRHIGRRLRKAVRPPARIRINRHKRRVTPGNWREVFDNQLRDIYEEQAGAEMQAAGYTWD
jgi:hypothetical protein